MKKISDYQPEPTPIVEPIQEPITPPVKQLSVIEAGSIENNRLYVISQTDDMTATRTKQLVENYQRTYDNYMKEVRAIQFKQGSIGGGFSGQVSTGATPENNQALKELSGLLNELGAKIMVAKNDNNDAERKAQASKTAYQRHDREFSAMMLYVRTGVR